MPVDTSIYQPYQPPNMLDMAGKVATMGNTLQQNRLMQAQEKQANIGIEASQLELARKRFDNLNSLLAPLAAKDAVSQKEIRDVMVDGIAQGLWTPQQMAVEIQNLPKGDDKYANAEYLRGKLFQIQDAQKKFDSVYGTPQFINQGSQVSPVSVSPMTGMRSLGAPLPIGLSPQIVDTGNKLIPVAGNAPVMDKGLSPEAITSPVDAYDPASGQPIKMTRGQFLQQSGAGAPSGINRLMGGDPGVSEPIDPNERVLPAQPSVGVPTGPALGAETGANVAAQANANQSMVLQQAATGVPQRKAMLGNMEAALTDFKSGPGSETWKGIISGFNTALPKEWNVRADRVASQEEFNKLAEQYMQSQFQSLGGTGTDSKLDSAMRSSPNSTLSDMGNKGIIAMLKGNEDAIAVMNDEWQTLLDKGANPKDYGKFVKDFNKDYDPRVFQAQYLDAKGKEKLLKGMNDVEKTKLRKAFNNAVDNGWIPDPRAQ